MRKYFFAALLTSMAFFGSCTEEASSRPSYIFKKAPDQTSAAKMNGKIITNAEIMKGMESEIYEAELKLHELKMNKLKTIVLDRLMAKHPKKKGLTNDQFLDQVIASKASVTAEDIAKFVKERNIPAEHINDQMKERVKGFLLREKKSQAIDAWVETQMASSPVEVYLPKPSRPVFDVSAGDAPSMGGKNAKVTLIEFSDFQCPYCAKGAEVINELKAKYKDKISIVFKNFPLPFHNHALKAAEAGLCVHEQDKEKFWKMHDLMFADQTKLSVADLTKSAESLKIDKTKFEKCLSSNKYASKVQATIEEGKKIGVKSTPTFFVNGMLVNGAQPVEVFSAIIDEELAK